MRGGPRKNIRDLVPAAAMLAAMATAVALAYLNLCFAPAEPAPLPPAEVGEAPSEREHPVSLCKPAGEVMIEVNIPATEMTLYEDGVPLFTRRVAIGQGVFPTPAQATAIERIEWNPWWFPPDAPWAAGEKPMRPGPRNPMGLVKLPLSREILFHGTNQAWSVGRPASHGCMRMHNSDVTELAWFIQQRFSDQCDPALREEYREKGWKTFRVKLESPVPVYVVYKPVVARDGHIEFFKDHYNRVGGRREAAILTELVSAGYDIGGISEEAVRELAKRWPVGETIGITEIMRERPSGALRDAPESS